VLTQGESSAQSRSRWSTRKRIAIGLGAIGAIGAIVLVGLAVQRLRAR
jgi:hypothetical protein